MPLDLPHDRIFPETRLSESVVVVPDSWADDASVQRLAAACGAPLLPQSRFEVSAFDASHVIACGHLASNAAVARLYNARCCFVDTLFPGGDDYLLHSVRDPFGCGRNAVVAGASSDSGLRDAVDGLTRIVEASDGTLGRVHAARLAKTIEPPPESELEALIERDLKIWDGGWVASPFRGGQLKSYLWNQYLTDHEAWGRLVAAIFAGSRQLWRDQRLREPHDYHDFFGLNLFIHLWDLVEDHPVYGTEDRHAVVEMFIEQLRHLAGLFYLKEEINPDGLPRQNHVTFIGLNLAAGHEYLSRRYGVTELAEVSARVERIFAGQALGYKPNDDAGVGYIWAVPRHTLDYLLTRHDSRYLDEGHVADLCRLVGITTDNLRSEVGYGDSSGFAAFSAGGWRAHLWPLLASVWHTGDATHLWLLNWLAEGCTPSLDHGQESWHASVTPTAEGFALAGVEPREPEDLLGVTCLQLPESALRWVESTVPEAHHPEASERYFDKLSLRSGFAAADEYLLLEGVGTFCHGHEDTNAILRLTWQDRAWLADGDYIRAAPKFHNSITVQRNGVGVLEAPGDGVVIPPLARLKVQRQEGGWGIVQSEVAGYNGVDWRRNLVWRKGRYLVVLDELVCREPGDYRCRCLWRVVGDVDEDAGQLLLRQQEAQLHLINADGSEREVVADAAWGGYPHHDGPVHVVHQKRAVQMQAGESLTFCHVFTPHEGVAVEFQAAGLRVSDGADTAVVALDAAGLPAIAGDGATGSTAPRLAEAASPPPAAGIRAPADPIWDRRLDAGAIRSVAAYASADAPGLLVGAESGGLARWAAADGAEVWKAELGAAASVLHSADIDGDGVPEVLAGTAASEIVVLDGDTGQERWRRSLKNLYDNPAPATTLRVADLEGEGQLDVLCGTAGWFVNVFEPDGTPTWAQWIRYHVITALEAADVDGDGRAEVIVGNTYSTSLTVHEFDGTFRWSTLEQVGAEGNATTPRRGIGLRQLRLADVDGDGVQEVLYGTDDGWLFAVDPRAGDEVWQLNIVGAVVGLEVLADSVLVAGEFGDLVVLGHDGRRRRHEVIHGWNRAAVRVGDTVVIAGEQGRLTRVNREGHVIEAWQLEGEIQRLVATPDLLVAVLNDQLVAVRVDG